MKKKTKMLSISGVVIAVLFLTVIFTHPNVAAAKSTTVPIEGMSYRVDSSLADNLKSLIGKKVTVTLDSGKILTGIVKEVGNRLVHLEKIAGKEYFDALIRIENINAIEAMFRQYKK